MTAVKLISGRLQKQTTHLRRLYVQSGSMRLYGCSIAVDVGKSSCSLDTNSRSFWSDALPRRAERRSKRAFGSGRGPDRDLAKRARLVLHDATKERAMKIHSSTLPSTYSLPC